jgi:hypothetical protein
MPPSLRDPTDERLAAPDKLPRGLIPPPREVQDFLAREKTRLAPHYTPEYEVRALNDLTLAYFFEHQLVTYRPTPQGPEVLAVGDEVGELLAKIPPEMRPDVHLTQP